MVREGKAHPVLERFDGNPILEPEPRHWWESRQTFNPGAILLEDKVHILYRAVGDDWISRFGYAASKEGFKVEERLEYPVYQHPVTPPEFNIYSYSSGGSFGGAEDPRLVRVKGDEVIHMTYTACDAGLRMALTSIRVEDFLSKRWDWTTPALLSPPGQVHKNWVIFPEKINGKYAILHSLTPQVLVSYHESLDLKPDSHFNSYHDGRGAGREDSWDNIIRGAGAPPIKTKFGWLVFYHAMTLRNTGKYKVGAMLLDIQDPRIVICRSAAPILEPDMVYENSGFKPGIVYLSGAIVKEGELLVYYGASDSYVCVASAKLDELLGYLVSTREPLPSPVCTPPTEVGVVPTAAIRIKRVKAFCVKCRAKREMKNPVAITLKNGRPAIQGTCPRCGARMFRMGKFTK